MFGFVGQSHSCCHVMLVFSNGDFFCYESFGLRLVMELSLCYLYYCSFMCQSIISFIYILQTSEDFYFIKWSLVTNPCYDFIYYMELLELIEIASSIVYFYYYLVNNIWPCWTRIRNTFFWLFVLSC